MNETTIVLPSARAIRERLLESGGTLFLPNFLTMSDFISRLCIAEDFCGINEDGRVLLLLEASDFKNFAKLQIERNFFTFTKNSSYIFKFFQELSAELYDINNLSSYDVYGEYEEHIKILQELYIRYEELCRERKIADTIFLPKLYTFNAQYVKSLGNIEIFIDGYLTNFEFKLLLECCEFGSVILNFTLSRFSSKMCKKFAKLGIELQEGFSYKIALSERKILEQTKVDKNKNISCQSFTQDILQVAFVEKKVYEFIQKGYAPHKIAVVLPNEKFAHTLRVFDKNNNYNFAMGEPFCKTDIYAKLEATTLCIEQNSKENYARLKRLGDEFFINLSKIYYKKSMEADVLEFLHTYKESFGGKSELKIFEEELYALKNILPYMGDMSIKSVLSIFLQRLSQSAIDDVRGGKITVMGVLETRLMEFDGVVIVDFSDENVPKKSDKDMFLNTYLREAANLPTAQDRENLQRYYYEMLINRSKEVAISFVKSEQSSGSKFLKELGVKEQNEHSELEYAGVLFQKRKIGYFNEQEIAMRYSFKNEKLSSSKLKTFLTCKRKYYYRHVNHIKEHEIPKEIPQEYQIGSDIHSALKNLYSKQKSFLSVDELKTALFRELDATCKESEFEKYLIALHKKKMHPFCELEVKRFNEGWSVLHCEIALERSFAGMSLVGQIDRIDKKGNQIYVLDYKTGRYPLYSEKNFKEATDFQLEFYYLLSQPLGDVLGCAYYDLEDYKIVDERLLEEKIALLESIIIDLSNVEYIDFAKCDDVKNCLYCEYKIMCGRE